MHFRLFAQLLAQLLAQKNRALRGLLFCQYCHRICNCTCLKPPRQSCVQYHFGQDPFIHFLSCIFKMWPKSFLFTLTQALKGQCHRETKLKFSQRNYLWQGKQACERAVNSSQERSTRQRKVISSIKRMTGNNMFPWAYKTALKVMVNHFTKLRQLLIIESNSLLSPT